MANIRLGAILADARGSIGSTVFSRNRGGVYIRNRVKPTNPQSDLQVAARAHLSTCQAYYRDTLTSVQRDSWEAAAQTATFPNKLGEMVKVTAINLFVMVNTLRLVAAQTILATSPAPPFKSVAPTLTFTVSAATGLKVTAITPAIAVGSFLMLYISAAKGNQVNYYRGPYVTRSTKASTDTVPWTLIASGTGLVASQRYFIQYRQIDAAGRISPLERTTVDITA